MSAAEAILTSSIVRHWCLMLLRSMKEAWLLRGNCCRKGPRTVLFRPETPGEGFQSWWLYLIELPSASVVLKCSKRMVAHTHTHTHWPCVHSLIKKPVIVRCLCRVSGVQCTTPPLSLPLMHPSSPLHPPFNPLGGWMEGGRSQGGG